MHTCWDEKFDDRRQSKQLSKQQGGEQQGETTEKNRFKIRKNAHLPGDNSHDDRDDDYHEN